MNKKNNSCYWVATFIVSINGGLDVTSLKVPDFKNFYINLEESDIFDWKTKLLESYTGTEMDSVTFVGITRIKGSGEFFNSL